MGGETYSVSFLDIERGYSTGAGGPLSFMVSYNGGMETFTPTNVSAWSTGAFDFTYATGMNSLLFAGVPVNDNGDHSIGLDLVSISAIPEPSTWAMQWILRFLGHGLHGLSAEIKRVAFRLIPRRDGQSRQREAVLFGQLPFGLRGGTIPSLRRLFNRRVARKRPILALTSARRSMGLLNPRPGFLGYKERSVVDASDGLNYRNISHFNHEDI